ncbi:uncharacterized protein LOC127799467 isoform X2 [Diospyros lotus]|uniref:uncharacterized protein LOC127799467 isoform X2 n=1 Tax=Diospyros lotus TaxID=55363 RepID=UPI00225A0868|nr:uncharacterized protein LOC127799467 isoform X2 [Diospyros lotus]
MISNSEQRNPRDDDADMPSRGNPLASENRPHQEKAEDMKLWGVFLFGLIGATATTFAMIRSQSSWKGATSGSFRSSFQEEAWKRYNRRMQEEYEEEMERVERIRRMQSVFNRERNKYKRSYESWRENGPGAYHQHFQREDWYWKTDTSYRDRRTNFRETPRANASYPLSHHYSVLGLDRLRTAPYSDNEIKNAFRAKAKEFHPDQNQENKELAEAKFKEVMTSYEAIKTERKNNKF